MRFIDSSLLYVYVQMSDMPKPCAISQVNCKYKDNRKEPQLESIKFLLDYRSLVGT